jgi:hypothetical protein
MEQWLDELEDRFENPLNYDSAFNCLAIFFAAWMPD